MRIDEAGRDDQAGRVDRAGRADAGRGGVADEHDAITANTDVGAAFGGARAVDERPPRMRMSTGP